MNQKTTALVMMVVAATSLLCGPAHCEPVNMYWSGPTHYAISNENCEFDLDRPFDPALAGKMVVAARVKAAVDTTWAEIVEYASWVPGESYHYQVVVEPGWWQFKVACWGTYQSVSPPCWSEIWEVEVKRTPPGSVIDLRGTE